MDDILTIRWRSFLWWLSCKIHQEKTFTLAWLKVLWIFLHMFQDTFSVVWLQIPHFSQRAPSFVKLLHLLDCFSRHVFCHSTGKPHLSQTLAQRAPSFVLLLKDRKQFQVRYLILVFSCLDFALKRTSEIIFLQEYLVAE